MPDMLYPAPNILFVSSTGLNITVFLCINISVFVCLLVHQHLCVGVSQHLCLSMYHHACLSDIVIPGQVTAHTHLYSSYPSIPQVTAHTHLYRT